VRMVNTTGPQATMLRIAVATASQARRNDVFANIIGDQFDQLGV